MKKQALLIFLFSVSFGVWAQISGPSWVCPGGTDTFSATVFSWSGYQWSVDGGMIVGSSTSETVTIQWYYGGNGTVYLNDGLQTYNQPVILYNVSVSVSNGATMCVGESRDLYASYGGTFSEWQMSTNGVSWSHVSLSPTITVYPAVTTQYRAVIYGNNSCSAIYSNIVTVNVYAPFNPGAIGSDHTLCYNTEASQLYSAADASGGAGPYTYSWERRAPGGSWSVIPGQTSTVLSPGVLTATTEFRRSAFSPGCSTIGYSNVVTVTVRDPLSAGAVIGTQTICFDASPTLASSAGASGSTGSFNYQWQSRAPGGGWSDLSGQTGAGLNPGNLQTTTDFRRKVTANGCPSDEAYSNTVTVTVLYPLSGGSIGSSQTLCYNGWAALNSASLASGSTGSFAYQWQARVPGGAWCDISGQTGNSYNTSALTATTEFRRKVISGCSDTQYSNTVVLEVLQPLSPGSIGYDQAICYNTSPAALANVSGASGSNGFYNYQWEVQTGGTWSAIDGATGAAFSPGLLTATTRYRRKVSTSCNGAVYSNEITVTVYGALSAGSIGSSQTICSGTAPASFSSLSDASGGNGTYVYQWEFNAGSWSDIPGAHASTYAPGALAISAQFRRRVDASCGTTYSNTVTVSVDAPSAGGNISGSAEAFGSASGTLVLNGYTGTILKWQSQTQPDVWTDITNTSASWNYNNVAQTTQYQAVVRNGTCPAAVSSAAQVRVYLSPSIIINGASSVTYGGSTVVQSVNAYYSYQWLKDGNNIAGATLGTLVVTEPGTYTVQVRGSSTSPVASALSLRIRESAEEQPLNFIRSIDFRKAGITGSTNLYGLEREDLYQKIQYLDGLGRLMQLVSLGSSPLGYDVVQTVVYDAYGRETVTYLPYATTVRTGKYVPSAIADLGNFYQAATHVAHDAAPYSRSIPEASPFNRIFKQGSPGPEWQPDGIPDYSSTDHTRKMAYEYNGTGEVLQWEYVPATPALPAGLVSAGTNSARSYFPAGTLYRNKTKDEDQHEVIEYKDKQGRVVLKRVQATAGTPPVDDVNYASTYYIYNSFGDLACVIPPEAVKKITQPASDYFDKPDAVKKEFLERWAFLYLYNGKRQAIFRKVPGAEPVYMVYDKRDRLVMTQDGNQRLASPNEWTFTKYDALNRPVLTGIYTDDNSPDVVQNNINTFYSTLATGTAWYETYIGSGGGNVHGYDNKSYPQVSETSRYLTVTYYDQYDPAIAPSGFGPVSQNLPGEVAGDQNKVSGQVTGTLVKNLSDNTWLRTVNYYDDKYRIIQTVSDHPKGTVRISNVYDFVGKVLYTKSSYVVTGQPDRKIIQRFSYDHAGRLLNTWHRIEGGDEVLLSSNEYNELGQLVTRKLHRKDQSGAYVTADPLVGQPGVTYSNVIEATSYNNETAMVARTQVVLKPGFTVPAGSTFTARTGYSQADAIAHNNDVAQSLAFAQEVDYRYNIRGWLTRINNSDLTPDDQNEPRDFFGVEMAYNNVFDGINNTPKYNGDIGATKWSNNLGFDLGVKERAYKFEQDPLGRLLHADHLEKAVTWSASTSFHEKNLQYDLNGNILHLSRKGAQGSAMDELTYTYNGNRLLRVDDSADQDEGFSNGNTTGDDYVYDANGNMTVDKNKGITSITYNHLNLPEKVTFTAGDYIRFIYDANGNKLSEQTYSATNALQEKLDYVGDFFYKNDMLQHILHEEGRVVMTSANVSEYQYFMKDHLGNVRLVFTTEDKTESATATMEDANAASEQGKFLYYSEAVKINFPLFDHTGTGPTYYSTRLSGTTHEQYGLAKSLSVMPGDTVRAEVYAKYLDPNPSNWTTALNNFIAAIANGTAPVGTMIDGGTAGSTGGTTPPFSIFSSGTEGGTVPKAYLNYVVFEVKDTLIFINGGAIPVTENAREYGQDGAHEKLEVEIPITTPGLVYIWLSNDYVDLGGPQADVYFDDFKVDHIQSPVVGIDDFMPFGWAYNSSFRENNVENRYGFQGQERNKRLNWVQFKWRNAMPDIGRFFNIDPLSEKYVHNSTFAFSENKVTSYIELEGLEGIQIHEFTKQDDGTEKLSKIVYQLDVYVVTGTSGENSSSFTANDVSNIESSLNMAFSGEHKDPESGVPVAFEFNVTQLDFSETVTKKNGKEKEVSTEMSNSRLNSEVAKRGEKVDDGTMSYPAFVLGQSVPGTDGGKTSTAIKIDPKGREGMTNSVGHEGLHFMLDRYGPAPGKGGSSNNMHHSLGGMLGRPIGSPAINKGILNKLRENVPRSSSNDRRK